MCVMYVCILGSYVFKHSIVYIIHTQYILEENYHLILSIFLNLPKDDP